MLLKRFSLVGMFALAALPLPLSDPVGVFALIDRVVVEPSTGDPQRIQLWGVFALADRNNRNDYLPAERGYLYMSVNPSNARATRAEWSDLKTVAGTDLPVGFGSRYESAVRVRPANEKVDNPDVYPIGFGLVKVMTAGGRAEVARNLLQVRGAKTKTGSPTPGADN
jgi:hypothetical protein